MISNPATWFINGSNTKSFTYEGGTTLYHFSPYDNNLSSAMDTNIVFFANDEDHALDVLKRMFKFRVKCAEKYGKYKNVNFTHEEIRTKFSYGSKKAISYLEAIENGNVKLTKAPMNQFYKVGWADNDEIL